jgi:cysteine sulfinate desulfinase/cysteine desulfurase-like protein
MEETQSTVRIGFGRFNTVGEIDTAALLIAEAVEQIGGHPVHSAVVA